MSFSAEARTSGQVRFSSAQTLTSEIQRNVSSADSRNELGTAVRQVPSPFNNGFAAQASNQIQSQPLSAYSAPLKTVSATLNAYGTVIYASSWTENSINERRGLYKMPVVQSAAFSMLFGTPDPVFGFYDNDGKYYVLNKLAYGTWVMGYDLYVYDTETKARIKVIELDDMPICATDVAYDPVSGHVFGCFSGEYGGEIYRYWGYFDLSDNNVHKIADMDFSLRAVAIDKLGQAYGIDLEGNLYKVAKETGTFELVGATGCPSLHYMSSAAYNDKDGSILLAYCNDEAAGLVEINPQTAASSVIATFGEGEEVIGMYIPAQAPDKAPATPGFEVSCVDGSMTANFVVTMPDKLYDGTDAAGTTMGYKIYANGTEVASGQALAGSTVNSSATLTLSGMYTFIAIATNEVGESNQAKAQCYVGKGTPQAGKNVVLSYADGVLTLTWDPVTESADGGYIDPAQVRYDIIDAQNNVVTSDLNVCSWTKEMPVPENITALCYGVIAKYDAKSSKAVMSNTLYVGHYNAPVTMDMKDNAIFSQHTVIDANKDNKTWKYSSSKGTYYSYGNKAADDWIISPAIYLEKGKAYDFSAIAHAYSDRYPERIEIKIGRAATAEAMTTTLAEPTEVLGDNLTIPASIVPDESGEYFIGMHAISDGGQWDLSLVSYQLSAPYGATAPDAVSDLKITPAISGDLNATVSFTTASATVTGAAYTGDMKLVIKRDGEVIKELNAAAATDQSFTDNVPAAARYTYTVEAYDTDGNQGRSPSASAFVGPNVPNPPASVSAVENPAKTGEVTLTWTHPTTDVDGNPLLPANLTYNVYLYDNDANKWNKLNTEPVDGLSYTFTAQPETDPQTFIQVGVQTINRGVDGEYLQGAGFVAVGPAYSLPFAMSNITDVQNYVLGINNWDGCEFGMKQDGDMNEVVSQDGDGQFFYGERVSSSTELGTGKGRGDLVFGKINLAGAKNPVFEMYTYKITDTDASLLDLFVVCDGVQTLVKTIDYNDDIAKQWTKKVIDLSAFNGKTVQPIIRYHSSGLVYCFFDNIKVIDMPDYDLGAVSVSAPEEVEPGTDFNVDVVIENNGRLASGDYSVELLANGNTADTKPATGIAAGQKATVTFVQNLNMASEKTVEYSARLIYADDADPSNNLTAKNATVSRIESSLPAVSNLHGTANEADITLTWDAVTDSDIPYDPTLESFENAEPFTKAYDGWTFIDRDGLPSGNLGNIDVPNHNGTVDPESFIVIDGTNDAFALTSYAKEYVAADGKQYIGSIYCLAGEQALGTCDDWAISPLLKGNAQTVTFNAKNASINYSELLQVWYSTEDTTDPDKFVQLESFNNTGSQYRTIRTDGWGDFSFTLPEGAKRFAFRVVSNDGMMLMIDAVRYIAADGTKGLELTGYNVYCNGIKVNAEPVATNTFVHADADLSVDNTYHVTAVYNRGESEAAVVLVKTSGIDGIYSIATLSVEGRQIVVNNAGDSAVSIVAVDGKVVYSATGDARVPVHPGIYLVRIGTSTNKLIVR